MNKFVLAAISFAAGAAAGFAVGYYISFEEEEETRVYATELPKPTEKVVEFPKVDPAETERPHDDDPVDPVQMVSAGPARIAQPGQPGVNYAKVQQIVQENGYTDPDDIQRVVDDPDNEETYEERIERQEIEREQAMAEYREKNKGKIVPIQREDFETDFPETDYDHKDLYYFTGDDILTDEDGNIVNEEEFIGNKPRQFGWMANDEDRIYIRNHPKETEYAVWKERCLSTDWWS